MEFMVHHHRVNFSERGMNAFHGIYLPSNCFLKLAAFGNYHGRTRLIIIVSALAFNLFDDVHSFNHFAEDNMLAI